jgi:hypothetical protein
MRHTVQLVLVNVFRTFIVQNDLQKGYDLLLLLFVLAIEYSIRKFQENERDWY